ncbi:SHOCT domain-containing protein [Pseudonocardia sp. CA-142604]|uniref:SHOCT domain-containing protein n=1 Tax=Pseudonocardia sp. CA-142604 TaxID=3240024 RepID=UPI003D92B548
MRGRIGRPGLLGTMARTAVIAGTATAVSGGVRRRADARAQAQQDQQTTQADQASAQAELASTPAAPPAPAPARGGDDLMSQLQRLADMKTSGLLDDAEFAAAKAKLLGS